MSKNMQFLFYQIRSDCNLKKKQGHLILFLPDICTTVRQKEIHLLTILSNLPINDKSQSLNSNQMKTADF